MTPASVIGVSRLAADLNHKPLTWGNVVSEGGLEPPCPIRALAPQASASAYSATRTWDSGLLPGRAHDSKLGPPPATGRQRRRAASHNGAAAQANSPKRR